MRRNEDAWQLSHDLVAIRDLLHAEHIRLNPSHLAPATGSYYHPVPLQMHPINRQWLRAADAALDLIDQRELSAAHKLLMDLFTSCPQSMAGSQAILTGHAHIDLVWLWTERIGEFKATHTFATMLCHLNDYPEFRFGYSQPASYEAAARFSPRFHKQVCEQIPSGRWKATGATDVESDTQLPCGEALARCFTLGQQVFF